MLTKNDCIILLSEIQNQSPELKTSIKQKITEVLKTDRVPLSVIKFINDNRQFDVANFYEGLRHNYNIKKSSPLYKNLVKEEHEEINEVLTTLASLNLQILLYAKKLDDSRMFLSHSRAEEITRVLNNYYKTYDLLPCVKLLTLIRSDLKAFEEIRK